MGLCQTFLVHPHDTFGFTESRILTHHLIQLRWQLCSSLHLFCHLFHVHWTFPAELYNHQTVPSGPYPGNPRQADTQRSGLWHGHRKQWEPSSRQQTAAQRWPLQHRSPQLVAFAFSHPHSKPLTLHNSRRGRSTTSILGFFFHNQSCVYRWSPTTSSLSLDLPH